MTAPVRKPEFVGQRSWPPGQAAIRSGGAVTGKLGPTGRQAAREGQAGQVTREGQAAQENAASEAEEALAPG